ncbi:sigma 54-interacting transcriptional regulator [Mariniflexile soesokkakense]|uniref:Sigma 54-interacting transcriptional regulator n=1 Tax=Mariniflexile soesokkakense TaxID=1343160 RepID=A0ABV0A861_9FLAO
MKTPQGLNKISKSERIKFFISLFQNSPIPKSISSLSTKNYVFVNPAWEQFTGYSKKEAIDKSAFSLNLVSAESGALIRERLLHEKEVVSYECSVRLKNGIEKRVLMSFDTIFINDEAFVLNTINNLDGFQIYKKQEKDLIKRTEELLIAKDFIIDSIENMTDGFVSLNKDWFYTYVNKKAASILGRKPLDLVGKHIWTEFPEAVGQSFYNNYYKAVETQKTFSFEAYYQHWDRWFENRVIPSKDGISIFFQDITDRIKAQIEVKAAKEFSENLIFSLKSGLVVMNTNGVIIDVNPAFCKLTNFEKKDLLGKTAPFPFWPPESYSAIQECLKKTLQGEIGDFEFLFMRQGGERFLAAVATSSIKNSNGEITAFFVTINDITERKKAEELLIKSEKSLGNFINNIGDPFFVKDDQSRLLFVNDALCKIFNLTRADIIGKTLAEDVPPEEMESFLNIDKQVLSTGIENINEESLTIKGKKPLIISTKKTRFIDDSGKKYLICVIRDITDRKKAENKIAMANEQLIEANKELSALRNQLEQENVYLRHELDLVFNYEEMVYGSAAFSNVLTEVEKVAPTNATVLLLGESGTGKELLARAVHNISLRNSKPLIKVNCSAIPRELMESELFGHKKGSFTGAFSDKVGKFELADGGTLFLDEIGELPLDMQPKILRFLQEGEIEVVGGTGLKKLDVRVIAATNRNLKEEIKKKQFREDLYFRLHVFPIEIPALRKRKDDIPLLVEHFVDKFNKAYGKNIKYISDDAMNQLKSYNWPGNIRELENLIERASILSTSETLLIPGFESKNQKLKSVINSQNLSLDFAQRNHIVQVLEQCNWKISGSNGAAVLLGLKPSTLRDKMAKLGIVKPLKN